MAEQPQSNENGKSQQEQRTEIDPWSPSAPNAEHFPNTANLLRKRKESARSKTPETSPERDHHALDSGDDGEHSDLDRQLDDDDSPTREGEEGTKRNEARGSARAILIAREQERQEAARKRREMMIAERNKQLKLAEQQRQRKVAVQREMRREAVNRFVQLAPALFQQLQAAGLPLGLPSAPKELNIIGIQQALMTDPRVCDQCRDPATAQQRVCPVTNKPHRRSLVVCAEKLLKLIGETRVNLIPRRDVVGEAALAISSTKARRGISINPQIFILSFYNAAIPSDAPEYDPLISGLANQLLDAINEVAGAVLNNLPQEDLKNRLQAFAKIWRQYAKVSQEEVSEGDREAAAKELVETTITSILSLEAQKRILEGKANSISQEELAKATEALDAYEYLLRSRLEAVAGPGGLADLQRRLEGQLREPVRTPPPAAEQDVSMGELSDAKVTTAVTLSAPVLNREEPVPRHSTATTSPAEGASVGYSSYTSGSETDVGRSTRATRAPMGPVLPPRWFVDQNGNSRPPNPEDERRAQFKILEHRARTAYDIRLPIFRNTGQGYVDTAAEATRNLSAMLDDAFWAGVKADLDAAPPVVTKVPVLIKTVSERLLDAIPKRLQARTGQEMRDVLDWDMLRYRLADPKHLTELLWYFVRKINEFGAPAREEALISSTKSICDRLLAQQESLGTVVTDAFKFLIQAIKVMREDIVQYQLAMMSSEIAQRAREYQLEFLTTCLPPLRQWTATLEWLQWVRQQSSPTNAPSAALSAPAAPLNGFQIRTLVYDGIIRLLASASTTPETRWLHFPHEVLYFDKRHIFTACNLVQLYTLRLMLCNTVLMLLSPRGLSGHSKDFLKELDNALTQWLATQSGTGPTTASSPTSRDQPMHSAFTVLREEGRSRQPMTLEELKLALIEEVNMFLASKTTAASTPSSPAPPSNPRLPATNATPLTDTECQVLKTMVDKLANTESLEYGVYEKRVVAAIKALALADVSPPSGAAPSTGAAPAAADPLRCFGNLDGLLADVKGASVDLKQLLSHHWESYRPLYEQLVPLAMEAPQPAPGSE